MFINSFTNKIKPNNVLIHEQNKTRHSSDTSSDNCSQHTNTNTMPNYRIGVVDTSRVDYRLPRCVPI